MDMKSTYKVPDSNVYSTGDFFDNNGINFHEKNPDGLGIKLEMEEVAKKLQPWFRALPELKLARGNHCRLPARKAKAIGLPSVFVKDLLEVYGAPKGWEYKSQWSLDDNTILIHGDGFSGKYGYARATTELMCNVVMGHLHTTAGLFYNNTERGLLWGMSLGALIKHDAYAFEYARFNPRKPIPTIGIVRGDGVPIVEPM